MKKKIYKILNSDLTMLLPLFYTLLSKSLDISSNRVPLVKIIKIKDLTI